MPNASRARLQYEAGQSNVAIAALTDAGDHTIFSGSAAPWSRRDGFDAVVRPDGLITGGAILPAASGSADAIDVAAGTAYIGGELVPWSASADVVVSRASDPSTHKIVSITVTSAGAVAAVAGTDGDAFSEVRGAAGGPPLIPADSIEIGQVRTGAFAAAAILASEIKQAVGAHQERWDSPLWDVDYVNGRVVFLSALPTIHTDNKPKGVHASFATPLFADVGIAGDFKPPELSYSVSSEQYYGVTVGQTSESLGAGSFTALLQDGVTDPVVALKGERLWFKFQPNRLKSAHILCQGTLGISRSFPAGDSIKADCTIAAETAGTEAAS